MQRLIDNIYVYIYIYIYICIYIYIYMIVTIPYSNMAECYTLIMMYRLDRRPPIEILNLVRFLVSFWFIRPQFTSKFRVLWFNNEVRPWQPTCWLSWTLNLRVEHFNKCRVFQYNIENFNGLQFKIRFTQVGTYLKSRQVLKNYFCEPKRQMARASPRWAIISPSWLTIFPTAGITTHLRSCSSPTVYYILQK